MPGKAGKGNASTESCAEVTTGSVSEAVREVKEGNEARMVTNPEAGWLLAITEVPSMRAREAPDETESRVRKSLVKSRTVLSSKVTWTIRDAEVGSKTGNRLEGSVCGAIRAVLDVMDTDLGRGKVITTGPLPVPKMKP